MSFHKPYYTYGTQEKEEEEEGEGEGKKTIVTVRKVKITMW